MRAVWVDDGNDGNWDLLAKHSVTWVFYSLKDGQLRKRLEDTKARGLIAGVYAAWNWYGNTTGSQFAQQVHAELQAKVPDATGVRVQLNDETHDPGRIASELRTWRLLRPRTPTSWTLEGFQGGWFTPDLVKAVRETRTRVVPQAYTGPMQPTCPLACVRDITRRGIPDSMVTPFVDGKALLPYCEAFIFTQGRLLP